MKKIVNKYLLCALICLLPLLSFAAEEPASPADVAKEIIKKVKDKAAEPIEAKPDEAKSAPEVVKVGIYLNDVQSIDTHANSYLLDFYMWFKWKNPESDPTASFEFMNHSESWATMITKPTEKAETLPDGWQYQVMHIQGRMSEKMNLRSYPFDKQNLVILMEDAALDASGSQYQIEEVNITEKRVLPSTKAPDARYSSACI